MNKINKVRLITCWVTTALIIILSALLILSCLDIYNSGERPFTSESIAEHFDRIAWAVYICIDAIVCGLALKLFAPAEKNRARAMRSEMESLKRLQAKHEPTEESKKEQNLRNQYCAATVLIFTLSFVYPVAYFLNTANFTISNTNTDVKNAVIVVAVATVLSFSALYISGYLKSKSIQREMDILKKSDPRATETTVCNKQKLLSTVRIVILLAAICFITLGVLNDGIADVLGKAIRICTECIGLG